jgi:hypothetical protein
MMKETREKQVAMEREAKEKEVVIGQVVNNIVDHAFEISQENVVKLSMF